VCFCFNPTSRGPCTIVCGSCIGPVSMLHGRSRLITSRQRGSVCERESGGHIFIAAACVRSHEKTTRGKMKQTHVPSASSEILYCFPQKRQSRSLDAKKKIFFNERLQVKGDYGVFWCPTRVDCHSKSHFLDFHRRWMDTWYWREITSSVLKDVAQMKVEKFCKLAENDWIPAGRCATKRLTRAGGNFCDASSISRRALKEKSSYQCKQADDEVYMEWCVTQQPGTCVIFNARKPQSHQMRFI
jgi:hypothetical protein